jgi:hypothetical protein
MAMVCFFIIFIMFVVMIAPLFFMFVSFLFVCIFVMFIVSFRLWLLLRQWHDYVYVVCLSKCFYYFFRKAIGVVMIMFMMCFDVLARSVSHHKMIKSLSDVFEPCLNS